MHVRNNDTRLFILGDARRTQLLPDRTFDASGLKEFEKEQLRKAVERGKGQGKKIEVVSAPAPKPEPAPEAAPAADDAKPGDEASEPTSSHRSGSRRGRGK